jgi:hypothetical protein
MRLLQTSLTVEIAHENGIWIVSDPDTAEYATGETLMEAYTSYISNLFYAYEQHEDMLLAGKELSAHMQRRYEAVCQRVSR